jgi:hypothetical protein
LIVTGAYLLLGLFSLFAWRAVGVVVTIPAPASGAEGLSVAAMAAVQAWLCLLAWRSLERGAPLRRAWLLILLSALAHAAGGVLAEVAGAAWFFDAARIGQIRNVALLLGGPVRMALLAAGLLVALRVLAKFDFTVRPGAAGWAAMAVLMLFTLTRAFETGVALGRQFTASGTFLLARDLILCLLSVEAVRLWLAAARMGGGPIARCWRAFAVGIFVLGVGEAALWAVGRAAPGWLAVLGWYVWFPATAAFALAPAHIVAASRRAIGGASSPAEAPAGAFPRALPAN